MPPLPNAPKAIKVQVFGNMGSSNWANIWYLQYAGAGPPTSADLSTLAASFITSYENFQQCMDVNVSLAQVVMTDMNTNTGNQGSSSTGWVGTRVGDPLPINVAACITKTVARRYRGGHPRFYLPGATYTDTLNERQWTNTFTNLLKTRADLFFASANALTSASTGACKLANVSYYQTLTPGGPPSLRPVPVVELITGFKVDSRIDSQRRRLN